MMLRTTRSKSFATLPEVAEEADGSPCLLDTMTSGSTGDECMKKERRRWHATPATTLGSARSSFIAERDGSRQSTVRSVSLRGSQQFEGRTIESVPSVPSPVLSMDFLDYVCAEDDSEEEEMETQRATFSEMTHAAIPEWMEKDCSDDVFESSSYAPGDVLAAVMDVLIPEMVQPFRSGVQLRSEAADDETICGSTRESSSHLSQETFFSERGGSFPGSNPRSCVLQQMHRLRGCHATARKVTLEMLPKN
eukprot:TRINITY_DN4685_c0_g1_i1.p2 TRINITY_DN4685_c0_g1~~TRINITY_DN4685_c0_g1_i1.p2  ORF type:complete len:250 (+),score=46.54 TRINITY_DN4685_c0_g1_i1:3-752(+)